MSGVVFETAKAKINLALHVQGRRDDGYHELDSIVAFADIGDELEIVRAAKTALTVYGPFAAEVPAAADNLVLRAYELAKASLDLPPLHIRLNKVLPVASGIGGGSADAAAALRGFMRVSTTGIDGAELNRLALKLGADVPVCLTSRACRMRGIGEQLSILGAAPARAIVLVNPKQPCGTAAVFAELGLKPGEDFGNALDASQPDLWRNDLEAPALKVLPVIGEVLRALRRETSLHRVGMSGSGATCFGLCEDLSIAEQATRRLAARHPDWWVVAARLG